MDIAELLKPSVSGVDSASVMTLSRGYIRPMPPPARIHPEIATAAGQPNAVVTSARTIADSTSSEPIRTATGLPSRFRQPALDARGRRPRQCAAGQGEAGERRREGVAFHQQVRQVHLGAEEPGRRQTAGKDHAGQAPAGSQRPARHQRPDGQQRNHDGGARHERARPPEWQRTGSGPARRAPRAQPRPASRMPRARAGLRARTGRPAAPGQAWPRRG